MDYSLKCVLQTKPFLGKARVFEVLLWCIANRWAYTGNWVARAAKWRTGKKKQARGAGA